MKLSSHLVKICSIFILLLFIACSKDDPTAPLPIPEPPTAAGSWSGTLTQATSSGPVVGPIVLNLSQNVLQVRGSGALGTLNISISGQNHYPVISFTCSSPGYAPFAFNGEFTTPSQMNGRVNGSGFANAQVSLSRN